MVKADFVVTGPNRIGRRGVGQCFGGRLDEYQRVNLPTMAVGAGIIVNRQRPSHESMAELAFRRYTSSGGGDPTREDAARLPPLIIHPIADPHRDR